MSHKHNLECSSVQILLSEYIDNRLSAEEMENIKTHLDDCEKCSIKHTNLVKMKDMILSSYMPRENVDFSSSIMVKINSKQQYGQSKNHLNNKIVKISDKEKTNKIKVLKKNIVNKVMFTLSIAATIVISIGGTIMYLENNRVENNIGVNVASVNSIDETIGNSEIASNVNHVKDEEYSAYDRYVLEHFSSSYDNLTPSPQLNVKSVNFEK